VNFPNMLNLEAWCAKWIFRWIRVWYQHSLWYVFSDKLFMYG